VRTYLVKLHTPEGIVRLEVGKDEYILDAAYKAGYDLPSMCLQGFCLTCACKLFKGKVDQSDAIRYYPEDMKSRFILICSAKPLSDLCLKTHKKKQMQQHRKKSGLPYPHG
jgi:ferredoxin